MGSKDDVDTDVDADSAPSKRAEDEAAMAGAARPTVAKMNGDDGGPAEEQTGPQWPDDAEGGGDSAIPAMR